VFRGFKSTIFLEFIYFLLYAFCIIVLKVITKKELMNFKLIFCVVLTLGVSSSALAMEEKELDIFQAAKNGNLGIVKKLLENGIDVNNRDKYRCTPLYWAAGRGHTEVVKLLLDKGADIDAMSDGGTALLWASYMNHSEVVRLLLESGADINNNCEGYHAQIRGQTALYIAKCL
jgi:hypothetical protein